PSSPRYDDITATFPNLASTPQDPFSSPQSLPIPSHPPWLTRITGKRPERCGRHTCPSIRSPSDSYDTRSIRTRSSLAMSWLLSHATSPPSPSPSPVSLTGSEDPSSVPEITNTNTGHHRRRASPRDHGPT